MSGKRQNEGDNPGAAAKSDAAAAAGAGAGGAAGAPFDIEGALVAALHHHRAGRLDRAQALYRGVLEIEPNQADALHLLGVLSAQSGDNPGAAGLIERAIRVKPDDAGFHFNLANVYKSLARSPDAIACYRRALAIDPSHHEAHNDLGAALQQRGALDEAAGSYRRALTIAPNHLEAHVNLGNLLQAQGKLKQAASAYRHALAIAPDDHEVHNHFGNALKDQGKLNEAIACYRRALAIDPRFAEAHGNLGNALQAQGRPAEAEESYRRALGLDPRFARAHNNLGNALQAQGRPAEAEESYCRALTFDPRHFRAHANLGLLLKELGRYGEAEESLKRALEIDPDYAPARASLALLLLLLGDFGRAWEHYVARESVQNSPRGLWQKPLPDELRGKRLLILRDQGLGDEIFFLRFAPELKRRGAAITYLAEAKIGSIIARLPFIDRVVGEGEEPEEVDFTLSVGDLPLATGMKSAADIPPPYPLVPEPERAARVAEKLRNLGPAPYVGITWRAGSRLRKEGPKRGQRALEGTFRQISLARVAEALRPAKATFLALQRLPEAGEIDDLARAVSRPVHDFSALNDDLEDMLALLALMDEYVTVSNANVHLRAGAGRTSRILVPSPPEHRWMAEGAESPWFPGCKVYRQKADGSWDEALAALARDLEEAFGGPDE